jgi:hypothetical protein
MLPNNVFSVVIVIACAVMFYRISNADYGSGILLWGLSMVVSIFSLLFLPFPVVSILAGQVLLFIGLTVYNLIRKKPPSGF